MLELLCRSAWRGASRLALLAIALGVALGVAVSAIHRAALDEFESGLRAVSGSADLEVVAARGMDESVYALLARLPDVAYASPLVERELDVAVDARALKLRVIGLDAFRAAAVQPTLLPPAGDIARLMEPGAIFLSHAAGQALGVQPGQTLKLGRDNTAFTVAGWLPSAGSGAALAVMDIGEAQWRLATLGQISRVALRLREGVNRAEATARIAAMLPPGVQWQTPAQALERADRLSRAYRVNLGLLALIALAVGSFLVAATQAAAIARRTAEIAFLRAAGLTRAQLFRMLIGEGALLGACGALLGIALGHALAALALTLIGADLGAGLVSGVAPALSFDLAASAGFGLLGVASAAAGAGWPARDALQIAPAQALRAGHFGPALRTLGNDRRTVAALSALLLALAAASLPPLAGLPLGGYAAIACVLVAAVLAVPPLARALARRVPTFSAVPLDLARARLMAEPGFASRSAAGVLAATALIVAMAVMVSSFRSSVDRWLTDVLPAELYLRGDRDRPWPYDIEARLASVPGVERLEAIRHQSLLLSAELPAVALIARPLPDDAGRVLPRVGASVAPGALPQVWASEAMADLYGWTAGREVELPLAGQRLRVQVAGLWRDYARQHGAVVIDLARYRALTGDTVSDDFGLWLDAGSDEGTVAQALRDASGKGEALELTSSEEVRRLSLGVFDRTFAATYALEAASALIGLAGIAAAFAASASARAREFGLLRHLGCTRRQIAAQLAAEGLLSALPGLLLGLVAGFAMSALLIEVVNRQSFHWSMDWVVPWGWLAVIVLAMLAASTLAAILGARGALDVAAVRAVKLDD
ncbi:ABC transporter permease [Methyloversatilis sp. XJ19-13]|uniref:FtsX-like permease family protein n=1 Tax=Methyloversatilis sp. XJ19-13 TaxID=2963430 RepID=UPI00211C8E1E|nr:ABC transporter permease [Methyloversatilis sp. XJ19-13]MCQ9373644.1 ABC transporter permease [Methyloversatilis sp. XJ19-13]